MNMILSTLVLAVLAVPVFAEEPEMPAVWAQAKPKVGSWAEYGFESKKGEKLKTKGTFRISVVGKEGSSLWLEQKMTPELPKPKKGERVMLMKMLMGKDKIEKAFMKSEEGVMDMTAMMARAGSKKHEAIAKTKMKEAGTESVTVPAGEFKATKYTFEEGDDSGDAWMKPGVGPYGLIKQVHKDGKKIWTMQLMASGSDAKSEIDEKTATAGFAGMPDMDEMRARSEERRAKRKRKKGGDDESAEAAMPDGEKPSFGGFLKKAMKQKAGLNDD